MWDFKLRRDVKFHNGDPFTADDVVFTFERMLDDKVRATRAGFFRTAMDSVKAIDDYTVRFTLKKVNVIWPSQVSDGIVPRKYAERVGLDGFSAAPIGNGPFQLTERRANERLTYKRFDGYFNTDPSNGNKVTPAVSGAELRVLPESETRISALLAKEVDMMVDVPSTAFARLKADPTIAVESADTSQGMTIQINSIADRAPDGQPNPYRDVRVRQALNIAVDMGTIIKQVLSGEERIFIGVPPGVSADPSLKAFSYNPTEAKRLLDAAGYGNGIRKEDAYIFNPGSRWPASRDTCDAVAGYLNKVGVAAVVREQEYATISTQLNKHEVYPMAYWSCSGEEYLSLAVLHLRGQLGTRTIYRGSSQLTDLYDRSLKTLDDNERTALYHQMQRLFYRDDTGYLFLNTGLVTFATRRPWTGGATQGAGEPALWAVTEKV